MKSLKNYIFVSCISLFCCVSCETDEIYTDSSARLEFSADTVSFDTVFTTIGSATKRLRLYNPYDKPINISSIKVEGGINSPYKLNIDGKAAATINDIRIEANDSAFVFVQVLIDPTNVNSPLVVEDSIVFNLNDNIQSVKLLAYGQDVHLIHDSLINTNQTWYADKPYLIDSMQVDSNAVLTIEAGVIVYLHRNGFIWVDGQLLANGTKEKPIVFRGDRLDKSNYAPLMPYDKICSQWNQIRFSNASKGNKLNYVDIRNAQSGIIAGVLESEGQAEIELSNCRIYNHSSYALLGIKSKIKAWNCVFANSRSAAFLSAQGGEYEFYHCTLASYPIFGLVGCGASAALMNYASIPDTSSSDPNALKYFYGDLKKAYFGNCILFGELKNEVFLRSKGDYAFEYIFDHNLIKGTTDELNIADEKRFIKVKIISKEETVNPGFNKIDKSNYLYDFELTRTSLAREIGSVEIARLYPIDYNGNSRLADGSPDAGAFEYIAVSK